MNKFKKIIVFICLFLLSFSIVTDFKRQEVKANALAGVIGGMMLEGSGAAATGAIVAAGPYVAAFAVICIGVGVVYNNREEIQAGLTNAYNYAKSQGKNLMDYFTTDANGNVSVKGEGVNLIKGSVKSYMADPSIVSGLVGEYTVPSAINNTTGVLNISFPLTMNESDLIILNVNGQDLSVDERPSAYVNLDGKQIDLLSGNVFSPSYSDGVFIALEYSSSGWKYWSSFNGLDGLKKRMSNIIDGKEFGNSICSDLTLTFKQIRENNANVSVSRLLGDSLGNTDSVDADITFRNPALEADKDVSVSVPVDATWDRVIGKTYDETLDATTGESEIEAPSIWGWLLDILKSILNAIKSILSFITDFLASLLEGLKDLLLSLLVPSDTYFTDSFTDIKNNLSNRLNIDSYTRLFNSDYNDSSIRDITINWHGQEIVIVKFTMYENFRNIVNTLIYAFMFFLLAIYNYSQVYKLIRGSDYVSASSTITHIGGGFTDSDMRKIISHEKPYIKLGSGKK